MSRDYKPRTNNSSSGATGGSFLLGVVIGLVLGLAIAVGVAWYINKTPTPFLAQGKPAETAAEKGAQAKPDAAKQTIQGLPQAEERQANKPRFEFYKILPGSEEPASEQDLKQSAQQPPSKDAYFLQAGAFQNAADADNLKAKLALLGMEASIQTASLPDKGVWHRVRLGPYKSIEDFDRVRATLKQNGIDASLIRVREAPKQ